MNYTVLASLGIGVAVLTDLAVLRTRLLRRKAFWVCYVILFGFQLIVNGILTGVRVVRYNPEDILGIRLAYAPVEDLGFGFALILLTLSCWVRLGRNSRFTPTGPAAPRGTRPSRPEAAGSTGP